MKFEGLIHSAIMTPIDANPRKLCNTCVSTLFSSHPFMCTFETDMCDFTQDAADDFDWTRASMATSTPGTGPQVDHTLSSTNGKLCNTKSSQNYVIQNVIKALSLKSHTVRPLLSGLPLSGSLYYPDAISPWFFFCVYNDYGEKGDFKLNQNSYTNSHELHIIPNIINIHSHQIFF